MKTLLVAATIFEIKGLLAHFNLPEKDFVKSEQFDVLITGVGMTATAFALGRHLSNEYGQVLNLGIAGSFNPNHQIGDLLLVTTDSLSELGAEDADQFLTIAQLGFGESTYKAILPERSVLPALKTALGITVNTVHGNQGSIDKVSARLAPDVESMEGAAVIYACNQFNLPCIQVRSISNYVEVRNKANWNISLAIKNLNNWAISFLTNQ
jgi:futalosine hydrolase